MLKDKLEEIKEIVEYFFWNIRSFFRQLVERIRCNIDLLIFFNKTECYKDWDYGFLYDYIVWKMKRMKDCIERNSIIADEDITKISSQIDEALKHYDIYLDAGKYIEHPEWMDDSHWWLGKQLDENKEKELSAYYRKLYETEQKAWDDFHETLKKYAQYWWD